MILTLIINIEKNCFKQDSLFTLTTQLLSEIKDISYSLLILLLNY